MCFFFGVDTTHARECIVSIETRFALDLEILILSLFVWIFFSADLSDAGAMRIRAGWK